MKKIVGATSTERQRPSGAKTITRGATILVVDDHAPSRKFQTSLLGYQGHRFLEACDGMEARNDTTVVSERAKGHRLRRHR